MNDLSQRVQAFLDAYAGDAPTEDTVVEIVGDLERERRRLRGALVKLRDACIESNDMVYAAIASEAISPSSAEPKL